MHHHRCHCHHHHFFMPHVSVCLQAGNCGNGTSFVLSITSVYMFMFLIWIALLNISFPIPVHFVWDWVATLNENKMEWSERKLELTRISDRFILGKPVLRFLFCFVLFVLFFRGGGGGGGREDGAGVGGGGVGGWSDFKDWKTTSWWKTGEL